MTNLKTVQNTRILRDKKCVYSEPKVLVYFSERYFSSNQKHSQTTKHEETDPFLTQNYKKWPVYLENRRSQKA